MLRSHFMVELLRSCFWPCVEYRLVPSGFMSVGIFAMLWKGSCCWPRSVHLNDTEFFDISTTIFLQVQLHQFVQSSSRAGLVLPVFHFFDDLSTLLSRGRSSIPLPSSQRPLLSASDSCLEFNEKIEIKGVITLFSLLIPFFRSSLF